MDGDARLHVVVIDDHPIVALGLSQLAPGLEVVAAFPTVEDYLRRPLPDVDAVLLDLQLRADRADGTGPVMGTAAIRLLLDAGSGPVVIYTSIAEEMLLAACLAAGATGAVTKGAPGPTITEVVRIAARGM